MSNKAACQSKLRSPHGVRNLLLLFSSLTGGARRIERVGVCVFEFESLVVDQGQVYRACLEQVQRVWGVGV